MPRLIILLLALLATSLQLIVVLAQTRPTPRPLTLNVKVKNGVRNKTAPLLHGLMYEEINVRSVTLNIGRVLITL
jgi:hypothetical protein